MTTLVDLSTVLADEMTQIESKSPSALYRSKLVSVRRLQAQGMSDAAIEKALQITIQPADRLEVEVGDPPWPEYREGVEALR